MFRSFGTFDNKQPETRFFHRFDYIFVHFLSGERAHNGAVKREGVKISKNQSHQSKENKTVIIDLS